MTKKLNIILALLVIATHSMAQVEPKAGTWRTWFISSAKEYRLPKPNSSENEISEVLLRQKQLDAKSQQEITYWNAGAPNYRWHKLMNNLWQTKPDVGILADMLLNVAIYDATVVAWDTKYAYNRPRPFVTDKRVKIFSTNPDSPSYPCEHSVVAGVATVIISHFFPEMADSVNRMAERHMASRIAAGLAYPSDTRAGFELGKRIAEKEIEYTKNFIPKTQWDGKRPEGKGYWNGKYPLFVIGGQYKTILLEKGSQFRPGPPPDFAKDMEELRNYKQTHKSMANAFFHDSKPFWEEVWEKKIFEYNLNLNPPKAAQIYAVKAIGTYDGFVSCFDAKYAYWGIRPEQYDPTFKPILFQSPPFPGYPSGHAAISQVTAELLSYFFPAEKQYFYEKAKEVAESRFQGGIHFRTDNEVALELGKKVGEFIIQKIKIDEDKIEVKK